MQADRQALPSGSAQPAATSNDLELRKDRLGNFGRKFVHALGQAYILDQYRRD